MSIEVMKEAMDDHGMTLRDHFAAKAMHGLLMRLDRDIRPQDYILMAADAYLLADSMLKVRDAGANKPSVVAQSREDEQ
jgi:hypothetical protein